MECIHLEKVIIFPGGQKPTSRCKSFKCQINSTAFSVVDKEAHSLPQSGRICKLAAGGERKACGAGGRSLSSEPDPRLVRALSLRLMAGKCGQVALLF